MEIIGKNFIGNQLSAKGNLNYKTFNPAKNIENETVFIDATIAELNKALSLAESAFPVYSEMSGVQRAYL